MTHPTEVKLPESLEVVAYLVTGGRTFRDAIVKPSETAERDVANRKDGSTARALVRLSDAESALKARDAEIERLRGDALGALVLALSCIRWQSFGECRTPGHGGAPPAPDAAAKAIEAAIATLGGRGQ